MSFIIYNFEHQITANILRSSYNFEHHLGTIKQLLKLVYLYKKTKYSLNLVVVCFKTLILNQLQFQFQP